MSEIILLDNIPSSSQAVNQIIFYKNDSNSQNKTIKTKKNYSFPKFFNTTNSTQNIGKDNEIKRGLKPLNTFPPK